MTRRLRTKIESIFSVLPDPDAREAIRETLKTFRLSKNAAVPNVKWAEFTTAGAFLRGGLASTSGLSVQLVASAEEEPDIAAMAAQARDGGIEAGQGAVWRAPQSHPIRRVVVISDGLANVGPSAPAAFADLAQRGTERGIQVSSIGVGLDYDDEVEAPARFKICSLLHVTAVEPIDATSDAAESA